MKNVTEIRSFVKQAANEAKSVIESGKFDVVSILTKVIGLIAPGREAVDEANQFFPELGAATNADMDSSEAAVKGKLTNYSPETQRDLDAIEEGAIAVTRMIARSRVEGIAEGRKAMLKDLVDAGQLSPDMLTTWS
jgi:regulator of sigma D